MSKRAALKRHISIAWERTICEYDDGFINNEARLQVSFVSHLKDVFSEGLVSRTVYVETPFRLSENPIVNADFVPDVVICSDRRIIGMVELKFAPRAAPGYKRDIQKLSRLFSVRKDKEIQIGTVRYRGRQPLQKFSFSSDVLLAYCAVHSDTKPAWPQTVQAFVSQDDSGARESIQIYGARTQENGDACVWAWPSLEKEHQAK